MASKVAILLCTYQAEEYLEDQLFSFKNQNFINWDLFVSDDNSSDKTLKILKNFKAQIKKNKVFILKGPSKGCNANFLSLACNKSILADYFAFSDQDDIWNPEKLERSVRWLDSIPKSIPALYCSRTRLINETGGSIGFSPLFTLKPSFSNALVQNIAGGNTMVFNQAARSLLMNAGDKITVVAHDWWLYLLVTGAEGIVFYDPLPTVLYRQHDNNLVGMNSDLRSRIKRIRLVINGSFRDWNYINISALKQAKINMTPPNLYRFELFDRARKSYFTKRLYLFFKANIYRQTLLGNIALLIAAIINKI